jgi:ubiquinone/menaquinone biosynthesis C-methylase UbiE
MLQNPENSYVPALSYNWLTPFYDLVIRWTMPELRMKQELIRLANIKDGQRVLDLGCGTATLTLLIKQTHPDASIVGIDGDAKILAIARRKTKQQGLGVTFDQGMAFSLPYNDASYERIVSSLVFHHMTTDNKQKALNEAHRVLRPGGQLHIADFGKPQNVLMRVASFPWQLFDGLKTTTDNVQGLFPSQIRAAGFVEVNEASRYMTLFGTLSLYSARKPS